MFISFPLEDFTLTIALDGKLLQDFLLNGNPVV